MRQQNFPEITNLYDIHSLRDYYVWATVVSVCVCVLRFLRLRKLRITIKSADNVCFVDDAVNDFLLIAGKQAKETKSMSM